MAADTPYRITAPLASVASVQAVPLVWNPYIGENAWGTGDPVLVTIGPPRVYSETHVYWGVLGEQFYVGTPLEGMASPPSSSVWNEGQALEALQLISGVTVVAE